MSLTLRNLRAADKRKNLSRDQIIALKPVPTFDDGRTQQCHKDECDINKIMSRFAQTGTISHVNKYQGRYADFADYDFVEQQNRLNAGVEIFNNLDGEIRREFQQNPQAFFDYVNDPANADDLLEKLPGLAKPGTQLPPQRITQGADELAAIAAANEPPASDTNPPASIEPET